MKFVNALHRVFVIFVLQLLMGAHLLAQAVPEGVEIIVAADDDIDHEFSAIDATPSVGAVVVWDSEEGSSSDDDILGQRFDSRGRKVGTTFQVNSYTPGEKRRAAVSSHPTSGDFVVVWHSEDLIKGQQFDWEGHARGSEFQVSSPDYMGGSPEVEIFENGEFVVVWDSYIDFDDRDILGRRYSSAGAPIGAIFDISVDGFERRFNPGLARYAEGGFLVTWTGDRDGAASSAQGRRFDANAAPLGDEFQLNTFTVSTQTSPWPAIHPSGRTLIAWSSQVFDDPSSGATGVAGRLFESNGQAIGVDFQVNSYTTLFQENPKVSTIRDTFVVTWLSTPGQDGDVGGIFARPFGLDGMPKGEEFQVNSYTPGQQLLPQIATLSEDRFMIVWQSEPVSAFNEQIRAQVFTFDAVFTDGFESGDLTSWSHSN